MRWLAMAAVLLAPFAAEAQFGETITVQRILVDVRATDWNGEAIADLKPEEFTVRIAGQNAEVESVTWIDDTAPEPAEVPTTQITPESAPAPTAPPGRLFIFFIQTDFVRNKARIVGQMSFTPWADQFIDSLTSRDRVGVFSFDSHLKFRRDLTNDKESLKLAVREALHIDEPVTPAIVPSPSMRPRLDLERLRNVADSETALIYVANALSGIPGPKTLLLIGWGLGERTGRTFGMTPKWKTARRALEAARVAIFALDTTFADYHDLEMGLQTAAKETGGFYAKTHTFAQQAMLRLERTLAGHYELEVRAPQTIRPGTHEMHVRVTRRGVTTLAPSSIIVRQ